MQKAILFATILITTSAVAVAVAASQQTKAQSSMDDSITEFKNEVDTFKTEVANTNLNNTGNVESLINKVYSFMGSASVIGGNQYLHEAQDALLAKIKETGEAGFSAGELEAIQYFAVVAEENKVKYPVAKVFE